MLGEDTAAVLGELGLSPGDITSLAERGIVASPAVLT
jgi:crotonobetainyl-CoA:carnitine CoA-transferase CaiB-like acyl-CoA transferase